VEGLPLPADARVFLGRLIHLDPHALVRLRPTGERRTALWARLPWRALVTREVAGTVTEDATFRAAELLAAVAEPTGGAPGAAAPAATVPAAPAPQRRDAGWRWPLPPARYTREEDIPADRIRAVAAAAAGTLRQVSHGGLGGRPVGARMLREALLDHIPVTVINADGERIEVPQRLVQAVVRMGFLGPADTVVSVRRAGRWVGLAAHYGDAWLPPAGGPLGIRVAGRRAR